MAKINVPTIKGGFNLSQINAAFALIVQHLNDRVLYRNNVESEPNEVQNDIDMNGYKIYNVGIPSEDSDIVRYKEVKDVVEAAQFILSFDPSLYVTRVEYDALEARVAALEAAP